MIVHDSPWSSLVIPGQPWSSLVILGHPWSAFLLFYRRGHFPVSVTQGYRDQSNHHFQERIHFNSYIILSYNMYELKWIFNWKWWFNWSLYPWVTGMSQVGLVNTCVNPHKFWNIGFIPSNLNNQIWPRAI